MGEYDNLNPVQKAFLVTLAEACQRTSCYEWTFNGERFYGPELPIPGAPDQESFYESLAELGFIKCVPGPYHFPKGDELFFGHAPYRAWKITVHQSTLDYYKYVQKGTIGQWWADVSYELGQERKAWAKLAWVSLGYVLGLGSAVGAAIALRLLGWISVGR